MADVLWWDAIKGVTRKFVDHTTYHSELVEVAAGSVVGGVVVNAAGSDSANCPSAVDSVAYAASGVIKASAGILFGITGYNAKASAQFIQIFNSATVPADAAVPVVIIAVPASTSFAISFAPFGKAFATGISWSNSSTGPTKTIGSADVWINALYK